ncbi:phosphoethanolamine transferase [Tamlana sp. 2_MG-2023]|uniref:phosphoethanolamine transferase n=1 Tax=unclassified Tamlana TaxID=2614803 RepID=UPI0026E1DCCD|nr:MULTISPECIES: phosphoethanolamine transferase [unclassified Tamlana]MDO6759666.1 phosphoethanolamine transferase [Tamlana sp. 2_MG-2023]MDO6791289.1 phosphoethanolamine transferase [Tamlana sp. 1_MG-2023]
MERLRNSLTLFLHAHKKEIYFYLILNAAVFFLITLASYIHTPVSGVTDRTLYLGHVILLQFSISGYIYFFTLNKWVFKCLFLPLFFILCLFSFWVYTQDISVTNVLITSVLETKPSIAIDLFSVEYVCYMLFIGLVLFLLNRLYNKISPKKVIPSFVLLSLISIYSYSFIENRRGGTFRSRLPYNVYFGLKDYFNTENFVLTDLSNQQIVSAVDNLKIVLVLGETVRADHLGLNGYDRETTPMLSQLSNVVSFKSIYTPHTYTASSLPRIITDAGIHTEQLDELTSVYDVFNGSRFSTTWIGNQELERSYESIVRTNQKVILVDSLRSVYSFNKALDEELLNVFKKENMNSNLELFSLHMMGSHWWYENRYSEKFRKFKPVIDSKYIPSLDAKHIINSYDNTLVYLDFFLNDLIGFMKTINEPTIVIYIADHGEGLGENGKWLHAQNLEACKNPAMLIWYSNKFNKLYPNKVNALLNNSSKPFSTDIIYHSLLDLIEVQNIDYNKRLSVFKEQIIN